VEERELTYRSGPVLLQAAELLASALLDVRLDLLGLAACRREDRLSLVGGLLAEFRQLDLGLLPERIRPLAGFFKDPLDVLADTVEREGLGRTALVLERADAPVQLAELTDSGGELTFGLGGAVQRFVEPSLLRRDVTIDLLRVVAATIRTEDRCGLVRLRRSRLLHARLPAPPGALLASMRPPDPAGQQHACSRDGIGLLRVG